MKPIRPGIQRALERLSRGARGSQAEVDEEIALHLEMRAEQLRQQGMDADAAREAAHARFAEDHARSLAHLHSLASERDRHMERKERLDGMLFDLRFALRALRRQPLFAVFVTLALGLGIGANLAAYSLLDRLLLRGPAHVEQADRVVRFHRTLDTPGGARTSVWLPLTMVNNLRENLRTTASIAAYNSRELMIGAGDDAVPRPVQNVTGGFFPLLRSRPLMGRFFSADEDAAVTGPLAVIGETYWRSEMSAAPTAVGSQLMIDGTPHTIVGIAPAGFAGVEQRRVDAWRLAHSGEAGNINWAVIGRLTDASSVTSASEDAAAVHRNTSETLPTWLRAARVFAAPITRDETGARAAESSIALWFSATSGIILLVTLANVVNLMIVRLARRRREFAIRVALGSGRARVLRLIALESLLLALGGGIVSLFVFRLTEPVLRRVLFDGAAAWTATPLDAGAVLLAAGVALVIGLIMGVVPALQAGTERLTLLIKGGQGGGRGIRLRAALTVVQATLAVLLLVGAGLFTQSALAVRRLDLGVEPDRVLKVTAQRPRPVLTREGIIAEGLAEAAMYRRAVAAVRAMPGVERASITLGLPFDNGSFSRGVFVPGSDSVPALPGGGPYLSAVSSAYFETMGTRLLDGRGFTDADLDGAEPLIVVGETMARVLWPGRSAIGACVHVGSRNAPCARVVGVAEDVHRIGLRDEPSMQYYVPLGQASGFAGATMLVRPVAGATVPAAPLRRSLHDADAAVRSVRVEPLAAGLADDLRPLRIGVSLFIASGALAFLVMALGIFSLMSYLVEWRTQELGIRIALGASTGRIMRLVIAGGTVLTAIGALFGLGIAAAGARWLQPFLFETSARDARVFIVAAALTLAVSLVAGWLPARRATRISPMTALRSE